MGITDRVRKAAAGAASVAVATTGLSNCTDNGAVDPPPPPLECNTVNAGQSIDGSATRSGDTVRVTLIQRAQASWAVLRVTNVVGGTIAELTLPSSGSTEPLQLALKLDTPGTTTASFRVEARLYGSQGVNCDVARNFTLTINGGTVQIALVPADPLPLAARQRAEIVLAPDEGRTVLLEAKTQYWGLYAAHWAVTGGSLDRRDGPRVRWTLPAEPGFYQAELLLDYGVDGVALDVLPMEVS
jgi:hypothetical protein